MTAILPAGFECLEPFVEKWGVTGETARSAARTSASPQAMKEFYDEASQQLESALAWLDAKSFDAFTPGDTLLMKLMLSLAHVSNSVEVLKEQDHLNAPLRARLRFRDRARF